MLCSRSTSTECGLMKPSLVRRAEFGKARGQCWGWGCGTDTRSSKLSHTHLQTHAFSQRRTRRVLLLPVVAELDGGTLEDTAEGDWLNFPVRHGVAEQADARVHGLLAVDAWRTEVSGADGGDLVDVEVDHLRERIWIITSFSRNVHANNLDNSSEKCRITAHVT